MEANRLSGQGTSQPVDQTAAAETRTKFENLLIEGHDPASALFQNLSLTELFKLRQVSIAWRDAVGNYLAPKEREAGEKIAALQGRVLERADWNRLRLGDLPWTNANFPALTYSWLEAALAFAPPGTITAEFAERDLGNIRPMIPWFDAHGRITRGSSAERHVFPPGGELRVLRAPPGGQFFALGSNDALRSGSLIEREITALAVHAGKLVVLTQALDADAPRMLETPFAYPGGYVRVSLSSNARFVLAVSYRQDGREVRLHDRHTDKMFTATVDMSCYCISVCDNGMVCLAGPGHHVKLEPPRSDEERTLVAHSEPCAGPAGGICLPSRQGDFVIKKVQEQQGDRTLYKLVVEGLDRTAISLEHPAGPSGIIPSRVTVSPLRDLAAVHYTDMTIAVYSLSAAKALAAAGGQDVVSAPIIFSQQVPDIRDISFGDRADILKLIRDERRNGEHRAIERTLTLKRPPDTIPS